MRTYLFYKVIAAIRQWRKYIKSPAAPADRSARRSSSRPPCCAQMSTVSMTNWWPWPWPWPVYHTDRSPKLTAPETINRSSEKWSSGPRGRGGWVDGEVMSPSGGCDGSSELLCGMEELNSSVYTVANTCEASMEEGRACPSWLASTSTTSSRLRPA